MSSSRLGVRARNSDLDCSSPGTWKTRGAKDFVGNQDLQFFPSIMVIPCLQNNVYPSGTRCERLKVVALEGKMRYSTEQPVRQAESAKSQWRQSSTIDRGTEELPGQQTTGHRRFEHRCPSRSATYRGDKAPTECQKVDTCFRTVLVHRVGRRETRALRFSRFECRRETSTPLRHKVTWTS